MYALSIAWTPLSPNHYPTSSLSPESLSSPEEQLLLSSSLSSSTQDSQSRFTTVLSFTQQPSQTGTMGPFHRSRNSTPENLGKSRKSHGQQLAGWGGLHQVFPAPTQCTCVSGSAFCLLPCKQERTGKNLSWAFPRRHLALNGWSQKENWVSYPRCQGTFTSVDVLKHRKNEMEKGHKAESVLILLRTP